MARFETNTQTVIEINQDKIYIDKSREKSIFKSKSRTKSMCIKVSAISGVVLRGNLLLIFGSGLPSPESYEDIPYSYPNCIQGSEEELEKIYNYLISII
ncbi:hypothetical protein [Faecalimicrobium dakarense]|uniref:hypothetical protein n=1 Tax=Faecalimicrobium dakarense TaxID=1301100 RepID=UPI0004BA3201|nr:hypothetical protein [[Clostridium] dakarense]